MDDFGREALQRLPLAEACYRVWAWVCQEAFLQKVFDRYRGRSYEKILSFSVMVYLIANALLQYRGSGRASFEKGKEAGTLQASVVAAFGKLRRLPIALSVGFLAECTMRLMELFPEHIAAVDLPASLADMEPVILDGKAIKKIAKRLKALRGVSGGVLGGRALVAYRVRTGLVVGMFAHADGHANDVRFVPDLLPSVRGAVSGPRIYLGDRQFCNLQHLPLYLAAGDHFLIRYHKNVSFTPDPTRPARNGVDRSGRPYREEWGVLGGVQHRLRCLVRRITLERPGSEPISVITDLGVALDDADRYPAADLLDLYLARWNIERAFQQVTEVFNLQGLIGSSPEASVFQFAFCLLMYNILQVLRAYVADGGGKKVSEVSTEKLFLDVQNQMIGCHELLGPQEIIRLLEALAALDATATRARLTNLLGGIWTERWRKSKPQTRGHPQHKGKRCHTSAYRILEEARTAKPKPQRGSARK
jgi:hypothetical protein